MTTRWCALTCASSRALVVAALCLIPAARVLYAQNPDEVYQRAVAHFEAGRVEESAAEFDRLAALRPGLAPELWQQGIALYYAGRYADCRKQFELHRTVNPNDVENAAWHFLCVAHAESPAKARAALLPVGPDARVPMRQVYEMFRGSMTPDDVLRSAGTQSSAQFFARLYVGLFAEAMGDARQAREHIAAAAGERYAGPGGYMHTVARVHLRLLDRR